MNNSAFCNPKLFKKLRFDSFRNMDGNIYIAMTPNKVAIITILYLKLLLYFSVNINKENIPTTKARKDPLEKVKSKFINEIISKKVFVLFLIK